MLRKITALSAALVITGGLLVSAPANAAVKVTNGVSCTKAGATTKTSAGTYKCAKNPLVKNAKLTWLLVTCINLATSAVKMEASSAATLAKFKAQIPVIQLGITSETARKAEVQAKLDAVNARLVLAQAKLDAATTLADKTVLTKAVLSWSAAVTAYKSVIRGIDATLKKLNTSLTTASKKPAEFAANIKEAKSTATLICTKGL